MSPLPFSHRAFQPAGRPTESAPRSGRVLERLGYSGAADAAAAAAAAAAFAAEEEALEALLLVPEAELPPPNFFRQSPCSGWMWAREGGI